MAPAPLAAQSRIDTRVETLSEAPSPPRARANDPRDRAFRSGGLTAPPDFGNAPRPAPRVELAPRPNFSLDAPRAPLGEEVAGIRPTIINPAIPGNGMAAEGMVNRRERRFLDTPAAGARFSAPVTW
ncbi:MAG TPA: hypothetical protein VGN96_01005 [Roseococcus sp.]|jgi:hypothetical protein|nr:hypothetical protein [Roseococcus sp.]